MSHHIYGKWILAFSSDEDRIILTINENIDIMMLKSNPDIPVDIEELEHFSYDLLEEANSFYKKHMESKAYNEEYLEACRVVYLLTSKAMERRNCKSG